MHMWESLSNQPQEQQPQEEQQKIVNLSKKKCVSCATEKTCWWRRSKLLSRATLCEKCYRNEALALISRQCYVCESRQTTGQWFKSKADLSFDLCRNCWVKEHAILANKVCINCKSNRTNSQWLKSKILEGADLCNHCYQKEAYRLSKFTPNGSTTSVEDMRKLKESEKELEELRLELSRFKLKDAERSSATVNAAAKRAPEAEEKLNALKKKLETLEQRNKELTWQISMYANSENAMNTSDPTYGSSNNTTPTVGILKQLMLQCTAPRREQQQQQH